MKNHFKVYVFGLCFLVGALSFTICPAQTDSIASRKSFAEYPFLVQDSPARFFTMRQVNENYVSGNRLYARFLNAHFKPWISYSIQAASFLFLFEELTHEEAHRSILSAKNIGSVSLPYALSKKSGFVEGVTDQTLMNLRDTDFPDFIRLYTAGFESDYMLNWRVQDLLAFNGETFRNIGVEYILRKLMLMQYTLMGFVKYDVDGAEEKSELKRDVVGNDFYGAVRHLFRPTMEFKRYTLYNELTPGEVSYMLKMGRRTFINLIDPNLFGFSNFKIGRSLKINAAMGHVMCPFGDFIDEKFWIRYQEKWNISFYLRQFENRDYWFGAGGASLSDFRVMKRISASMKVHWWSQPENFGFDQQKAMHGGAAELTAKYQFYRFPERRKRSLAINVGAIYKTKGFLPEELFLQKHFGLNAGFTVYLPR